MKAERLYRIRASIKPHPKHPESVAVECYYQRDDDYGSDAQLFVIYCKSEQDAHALLTTLQTVDVECERQGS